MDPPSNIKLGTWLREGGLVRAAPPPKMTPPPSLRDWNLTKGGGRELSPERGEEGGKGHITTATPEEHT